MKYHKQAIDIIMKHDFEAYDMLVQIAKDRPSAIVQAYKKINCKKIRNQLRGMGADV